MASETNEEGTAARPVKGTGGKRRPPSPTEQARRRAWGKEWGARNREYAEKLRAKETK